ncbi:MAG: DNA repair protein RadC [Rikenellaceae bacterium]
MARGVASLSDKELLLLLLGDMHHVDDSVDSIFAKYPSLSALMSEDIARLRMVEGLGLKRAQRIVVAAELGRRFVRESASAELSTISSSRDVVDHFKPKLALLPHEECWVLYLTSSNSVVESQRLSVGGVTATIVDHRLIVKRALELLSTQIIMIHNHPSGSVEPSCEDIELTRRVSSAASLFDIKLLDHIIIGRGGDCSFLSKKLL